MGTKAGIMDVIEQTKNKMKAAIEHLKTELKAIRTGRANPGMVDSVSVEVYGTHMRIKDLASVTSPESKQILISPFDPKNAPLISKAIEKANIGIMPKLEGHSIRLTVPAMNEEMRKEMVKLIHKKLEEAKVSIRAVRRDANDQLKKQKSSSEISEDILGRHEKEIQKLTDDFCREADDVSRQKESEVVHI
jgi:ribosome recycling factor